MLVITSPLSPGTPLLLGREGGTPGDTPGYTDCHPSRSYLSPLSSFPLPPTPLLCCPICPSHTHLSPLLNLLYLPFPSHPLYAVPSFTSIFQPSILSTYLLSTFTLSPSYGFFLPSFIPHFPSSHSTSPSFIPSLPCRSA